MLIMIVVVYNNNPITINILLPILLRPGRHLENLQTLMLLDKRIFYILINQEDQLGGSLLFLLQTINVTHNNLVTHNIEDNYEIGFDSSIGDTHIGLCSVHEN